MKFKKRLATLIVSIILISVIFIPPKIKSASESLLELVFPVISDIHIGELEADKKFK